MEAGCYPQWLGSVFRRRQSKGVRHQGRPPIGKAGNPRLRIRKLSSCLLSVGAPHEAAEASLPNKPWPGLTESLLAAWPAVFAVVVPAMKRPLSPHGFVAQHKAGLPDRGDRESDGGLHIATKLIDLVDIFPGGRINC